MSCVSLVQVSEDQLCVVVIKDIPENTKIAGEALSKTELKDLNRARAYLADVVRRNGLPVFSEVSLQTSVILWRCHFGLMVWNCSLNSCARWVLRLCTPLKNGRGLWKTERKQRPCWANHSFNMTVMILVTMVTTTVKLGSISQQSNKKM